MLRNSIIVAHKTRIGDGFDDEIDSWKFLWIFRRDSLRCGHMWSNSGRKEPSEAINYSPQDGRGTNTLEHIRSLRPNNVQTLPVS